MTKPTESELEILSILWEMKEASVRQVHERLTQKKETGYTTTLKIMQIMHAKGLVSRDEQSRSHIYKPATNQTETQSSLLKNLMNTAFGGSAQNLVMQALGQENPSKEELDEIRAFLDQLEKKETMNLLNEWIPESLLSALGWTLIHSLWQIVLISAVLWIGLKVFKYKSPAFKYRMAYSGLLLSLMAMVITFGFVFDSGQAALAASVGLNGAMDSMMNATPLSGDSSIWAKISQSIEPKIPLLVNVWFIGALLFLVRLFGNLAAVRQIRISSQPNSDFDLDKIFYRLIGKMGLGNSIELRIGQSANSPLTFGVWKPVILLPASLAFQLTPAQMEAILAHELAHIKRYDYLANVIQSSMEVIFFYHPSFWWMSQTVKELRENAADDLTVKAGVSPDVLARSLAKVLNYTRGPQTELALAAAKKRNPTLQRIKRILGQEAQTYPQNPIISIPMIFTLFITLGLVATTAKELPESLKKVEPLVELQVPEMDVLTELTVVLDTAEKAVIKELVVEGAQPDVVEYQAIQIDAQYVAKKDVFIWEDGEGVVVELKGTGEPIQIKHDNEMFIFGGDTIKTEGIKSLTIDSMVLDMSSFPVMELAEMPNIEVIAGLGFMEGFESMPPMDFDMPMNFDFDMEADFEGFDGYNFEFPDTTGMTEKEKEEWVKEVEERALELSKKLEKQAEKWEKEMGPKMKEYEAKMKEWQEQWEPKMKEYEEKIKAWQKENEPKMKEFEEKIKAWQEENEPRIEEFQRKMEIWQKENGAKMEELVEKLQQEAEQAQKEAVKLQKEAEKEAKKNN